jgi:RsiW-degrading membrane proteinase PrsW (M82 family)
VARPASDRGSLPGRVTRRAAARHGLAGKLATASTVLEPGNDDEDHMKRNHLVGWLVVLAAAVLVFVFALQYDGPLVARVLLMIGSGITALLVAVRVVRGSVAVGTRSKLDSDDRR